MARSAAKKPHHHPKRNRRLKQPRFSMPLALAVMAVFGGMGAYLVLRGSAAPQQTAPPAVVYRADINGDGKVNGQDVSLYGALYAKEDKSADLNGDSLVNALDLQILRNEYRR